MKKGICLLLALALLGGLLPAAGTEAGHAVRHTYTLDFTLDVERNSYAGTEAIRVFNGSGDTWDTLCLRDYATVATLASRDGYRDADGNEVFIEPGADSSRISGAVDLTTGESLSVRRDADDPSVVYLDLPTPLSAGEVREIRFDYEARLYHGRGNLCRWEAGGAAYLNLGNFYPVLAVYERGAWQAEPYSRTGEYFYSPLADYDVTLTAPARFTAAASTAGEAPVPTGESLRWHYAGEGLRDFAVCLSDGFQMLTGEADGTRVRVYCAAGQEEEGMQTLRTAETALAFFGAQFGCPYPYDTFTVALAPLNLAGMEYPGLVLVNSGEPDTVVHETAHQWFYALVGSNSGAEPWLDESLAEFATLLYLEEFDPEAAAALRDFRSGVNAPPHGLSKSVAELGQWDYVFTVYFYGFEFLYGLREAMGEASFDESLREYVGAFAGREARTADFVRIFLDGCGWNEAVLSVMEEYLFPAYADMEDRPEARAAGLCGAFGLLLGTGADTFDPDAAVSRAMAATVLYRLAGYPGGAGEAPFSDVAGDAWYARAAAWAAQAGVVLGVGGGRFAPDRAVTRAEFLTMLERCGYAVGEGAAAAEPPTRADAAVFLAELLPGA